MKPARTIPQVLVVNSFDDCDMYAEYLRDLGLTVHAAPAPEQGLDLVATVGCDVVITDYVFARSTMSGASFIRELRSRVDAATSIIVIAGCVRLEDRKEARQSGADLFLIKPALPSAVLFEVRRALVLRRKGRRLVWNWHDLPEAAPHAPRPRSRAS